MLKDTKIDYAKHLKEIKKIIIEFLELVGLADYQLKVKINDEGWVEADIKYDQEELLVGHYGDTLFSLQLVLRLILYKHFDSWVPLVVNVNDYLQNKRELLEKTAHNVAQKVKFSNTTQQLEKLSAAERRIIHMALKDNPDVVTESIDTEYGRNLLIKPKK